MHRTLLCVGAGLLLGVLGAAANDSYDAGVEPARLARWPAALKDYQVLPDSQSPDHRFAFLYPKRSIVEETSSPIRLFLIEQKPFRILTELPIKEATLAGNAHGDYQVTWTAKSRAAVFIVEGKWGPYSVFVVSVINGNASSVSNLTSEIGRLVKPDYLKSKAGPFNDYFEFVFDEDDYIRDDHGVPVDETTYWRIRDDEVDIKCICTNDPKHLKDSMWEVIFEGTWNISQRKFLHHTITRIPQKRLAPT